MSLEVTGVLKIIKALYFMTNKASEQIRTNETAAYAEIKKAIKRIRDEDDGKDEKRRKIDNSKEKEKTNDSSYDEESESYEYELDHVRLLKVVDLKKKCKEYNLPTTGRKMDLVERLEIYLTNLIDNRKTNKEVETSSSSDETVADDENSINNDIQDEENSVIIYPQDAEMEVEEDDEVKQQQQQHENNKEEEKGMEEEIREENSVEEVKNDSNSNIEEDGNEDSNEGGKVNEVPVEKNENDDKQKKTTIDIKLFNLKECEQQKCESLKDEEKESEIKNQKLEKPVTDLNGLLKKIRENAPKSPSRPSIESDIESIPIISDLANEATNEDVVEKNSVDKKKEIIQSIAHEDKNENDKQSISSSVSSKSIEEEDEKAIQLKRKIEAIQSKLKSQQKKNIKEIITKKCLTSDTPSQNDSSDKSSLSSSESTDADQPALKKMKISEKESLKIPNQIETKAKQPSNLCGNINSFIKKQESINKNPSNISKKVTTFIKMHPTSEDSKNKSLLHHKSIDQKTNQKMFVRDKEEPKKEVHPSSYKVDINKCSSHTLSQLPSKTTTTTTTVNIKPPSAILSSSTNYLSKKEVPKYSSMMKKEVKDVSQQQQQPMKKETPKFTLFTKKDTKDVIQQHLPVKKESKFTLFTKKDPKEIEKEKKQETEVKKEVIKEIINVDDSQDSNSANSSNSSINNNSNNKPANNNNSQLSWADPQNLMATLRIQSTTFDMDSIFGEVTTCDIDQIFPNRHRKPRGSSGNWLNDQVTREEEERYKIETKYGKYGKEN